VLTEPEPLPLPGAVPGAMPGKPGQKRGAVPAAKDERAAFANLIAQALAGQVNRNGPPRDLVDELVEEQAAQWAPLLGPLVEPLLAEVDKALASGESLQAFAARLPDLIPKLDAQPITQALARAAFSARLTGEADIDL
jgi:phage gp29-like protein